MAITSYWTPGQYGVQPDYTGSPLYNWQADLDRQGYYANFLGSQNYLGGDMRSDLARSLYNRFDQGFSAAQFERPDLRWSDYLRQYEGKIGDVIQGIDPGSRGVRRNDFVGGARWLPRS
jgi:hypothetical protein